MADMNDDTGDRDQLHDLRELHLDALHRFQEEIDEDDRFEEFTAAELKVRSERMKDHFESMEKAHILYRQCCILSSDCIYIDAEREYLRVMAKIETRIKQLDREEAVRYGPRANSTMDALEQSVIRLEPPRKPQIGKFNGEPADWPAFRDLFLAEVHNRQYDPVTKLLYLREACVGAAADTLGPWQPTAANYQLAWDSMLAAYDDEYHVIHGILGKMHETKKHEEESHASLRAILDSVNSGTRQLQAITTPAVLADQIWIHFAKQRLPNSTLDAWEQYRNRERTTALPTLDEFKQFLDLKSKARREFESKSTIVQTATNKLRQQQSDVSAKGNPFGNRPKPYDRPKKESGSTKNDSHGFDPPSACIMSGCDLTHYLGQCMVYRKLTYDERQQIVKDHRLCRCCLTEGHMTNTCQRLGCRECPEIKIKHHWLLCAKANRSSASANDSSRSAQSQR